MKRTMLSLVLALSLPLHCKSLFSEVEQHVSTLNELEKPSNSNPMYPRYDKYHQLKEPSWMKATWEHFKKTFNVVETAFWHYDQFKDLLAQAIGHQEKLGRHGRYIQKQLVKPQDRLVIFGDLQGALHSFTRCIRELINQKILTEDLKLTDKNTYLVFTGNIVKRSPYLLETLHIALLLFAQNPDKVLLLRGTDEDRGNWKRGPLKTEITHRVPKQERKTITDQLEQLFNNMPLALIAGEKNKEEYILVNSGGLTREIISLLKQQQPSLSPKNLIAQIQGVSESFLYHRAEGLTLLPPQRGVTTWGINSSPTYVYQQLFDAMFDAFAIVSIGARLSQTTISLHSRDIRKDAPFSRPMSFCMGTGAELTRRHPRCSDKPPIVIGSTVDLSKGISPQGRLIEFGMALRVNQENLDGGIKGHPIKLVVLDDEYNPQIAKSNVEQLIKDYGTTMILAPTGTPTLHGYLDKVKNKVVFVYFPVTGDQSFRNKELTSLINFRPSYTKEGEILMNYAFDTLSGKRFVILYQRGIDALDSAKKIFEERKSDQILKTISYERNQTDFTEIVKEIKTFNPSEIFLFTTSIAGMELIRQLGVAYLSNRKILALSDMSINSFREFMRNKGVSYSYIQLMPPKDHKHHAVVKNYLHAIEQYNLPYDPFSLEGYVAASLIINALENISGPITAQKVMSLLEASSNQAIDGVRLKFNDQSRELAHSIWLVENADTPREKTVQIKVS